MRKVFRLLGVMLGAIVDIVDAKPKTESMNIYEAQEKLELNLICIDEYTDAIRESHRF